MSQSIYVPKQSISFLYRFIDDDSVVDSICDHRRRRKIMMLMIYT